MFERTFLELLTVETTESRRQPAEHPNHRKLRANIVGMDAETRLSSKGAAKLGLALQVAQRAARKQKGRVQGAVRVCCISEIADATGDLESAAVEINRGPHMLSPGGDPRG